MTYILCFGEKLVVSKLLNERRNEILFPISRAKMQQELSTSFDKKKIREKHIGIFLCTISFSFLFALKYLFNCGMHRLGEIVNKTVDCLPYINFKLTKEGRRYHLTEGIL